jgi:hypothetical protein
VNELEKALEQARLTGGSVHVTHKPKPKKSDDLVEINTKHSLAVRKQLKQLAMDLDKSQQDLVAEALNMLFRHYQRPPIA